MAETTESFEGRNLRGARFVSSDLSGAVMRGVEVGGLDIDSPWLFEGGAVLLVNGVDVAPFIDAELNERFPGRELRQGQTPDELRAAWAAVERAWGAAVERVTAMPPGTVDVSVDGEWSFAQTLRHLVMATGTWLGRGIRREEQPYHPIGLPNPEYESDGGDMSVFTDVAPPWEDVLAVRADHVADVRRFLEEVTADDLEGERPNPWAPEHTDTVRSCLHVILGEEWDHLRYATRDLDAIETGSASISAG